MRFLAALFLLSHGFGFNSSTLFQCFDEQESDCRTRMCFYSIDHEKNCYRTGCATQELCTGRRHNECFISDGLHTCCCMEPGCAENYKGLNDCVDEPKNETDITASIAYLTTQSINSTTPSITAKKNLPSDTAPAPTDLSSTLMTEEFITNNVTQKTTLTSSTISATKTRNVISEATQISTAMTETVRTPDNSTTRTSQNQSSIVEVTQTVASATPDLKLLQRTTRYSAPATTITSNTTTTLSTTSATVTSSIRSDDRPSNHISSDLYFKTQAEQNETTTEGEAEIAQLPTTASTSIISAPLKAPGKKFLFAEQRNQLESEHFISSAMRGDRVQKLSKHRGPHKTPTESATPDNGKKILSSSLISVHEVTTQAAKNKEEQPKAMLPWWSAVLLGFLVSAIAAWVIILFLQKRKQQRKPVVKSTDKDNDIGDPLLKTAEASESTSSNNKN